MPGPEIKTLRQRPVRLFSVHHEYFFTVQRFVLEHALPPCFEDAFIRIYVTGGYGRVIVNGVMFRLQPGSECLFSSYHVFELIPDDGTPLELAVLAVDYSFLSYLRFNNWTLKENNQGFYACPVIFLPEAKQQTYQDLLARFEREDQRLDSAATLMKVGLYGQLSMISRGVQQASGSQVPLPLGWRILLYLTKFNSQNLTAASGAQAFGISVQTLNRELRRITGYNFGQLLSRARVNTVCSLLPLEGFSLHYLGNYIGFTSEKMFYRAFRIWKGMTPQEYRNTVPTQLWGHTGQGIRDIPWSIINYICSNYREPITPRTAAKSLYLSEAAVKQALLPTGATFQEHLLWHRLHYACALLTTTDLLICDVAAESGFGSVSTFCRRFKDAYAATALEYRKKHGVNRDEQ